MTALIVWLVAYLIGSIPFGTLAGRWKGVDLSKAGSGNVGATNASRVLGRRVGGVVFACDFLKGAIPVALAPAAAELSGGATESDNWLRVGAGAAAFLGHVFPVTLGFRGGKGVATGAGVAAVVAPLPAALGICAWVLTMLVTRTVSAASLAAAAAVATGRVALTPDAWGAELPGTLLCVVGCTLVAVRHRGNAARVAAGTEPQIREFSMRLPLLRGLHSLALGLWFGGAAFFSFAAAPAIFASFTQVVAESPSDRTANLDIVPPGTSDDGKKALASALAGAAVGPVFPKFFAAQAAAAVVALATGLGLHARRWRLGLLTAGLGMVLVGWPISQTVSEVRLLRASADPAASAAAKAAFGPWHLASLGLSALTTLIAGASLATVGQREDVRPGGAI